MSKCAQFQLGCSQYLEASLGRRLQQLILHWLQDCGRDDPKLEVHFVLLQKGLKHSFPPPSEPQAFDHLAQLSCRIMTKVFPQQKGPIVPWERSGVYRLRSSSGPAVYTQETGGQFTIRIREHLDEIVSDSPYSISAFTKHIKNNGHSYSQDNVVFLHFEDS